MELSVVKDIVLIIASLTTTVLALYTINKWKKEHKAKAKFDCAYKCLKALYTIRDSFGMLRSSFTMAYELPPDYTISVNTSKEKERKNTQYVINNRFKSFQVVLNEYYSMLPEVEVIFGKDVLKHCRNIHNVVVEYTFAVNEYLQLVDETNNKEHLVELRKKIYNIPSKGEVDKLSSDLENIILDIEKEIKRYISLK